MTAKEFEAALRSTGVSEPELTWFPHWLKSFARFLHQPKERLHFQRSDVISFLRLIKQQGKQAWQRLQAVQSIESYRDHVLRSDAPDLKDVREILSEAAHRRSGRDEPGPIGKIDPAEPEVIQQLRKETRLLHYSWRTEKAYVGWARRFLNDLDGKSLESINENAIAEWFKREAVGITLRRVPIGCSESGIFR